MKNTEWIFVSISVVYCIDMYNRSDKMENIQGLLLEAKVSHSYWLLS